MGNAVANAHRSMPQSPCPIAQAMGNRGDAMAYATTNPLNSMPQGLKRTKNLVGQGVKRLEKPVQELSDHITDKGYKIGKR